MDHKARAAVMGLDFDHLSVGLDFGTVVKVIAWAESHKDLLLQNKDAIMELIAIFFPKP